MATGLGVWLGTAKAMYGAVTVATTGEVLACVYGVLASAFSPVLYTVIITAIKPQNFDWNDFRKEKLAFETHEDTPSVDPAITEELAHNVGEGSQPYLQRWVRIAAYWSIATFLGHWVLWPLPMYASRYIFSKTFFSAWLVVAIIWIWGTMLVAGFFPLIGGVHQFKAVWVSLRRGWQSADKREVESTEAEKSETDVTTTPTETVHIKE